MNIEKMIYVIRGQKVMMDSDLAELYKVEVKVFPTDFMFECDFGGLNDLRSQFVTANPLSPWNSMRRTRPMLFTESGVAMLSSVLNSDEAIQINVSIMRTFIKLSPQRRKIGLKKWI